jgi:hypothetical protein
VHPFFCKEHYNFYKEKGKKSQWLEEEKIDFSTKYEFFLLSISSNQLTERRRSTNFQLSHSFKIAINERTTTNYFFNCCCSPD